MVRHEIADGVLTIWNCNTARRNALSPEYYQGVISGLAKASDDPGIVAVILAGEGGFFCSGGDLNTLKQRRALTEAARRDQIEQLNNVIRGLKACRKPVIAAVEGGAAGAGLSIALACDLIVAGESAKFTLAYVKAGLVPDGGVTWSLMQALPRATVARMAMLGAPIDAPRMYALGVVSELVADADVLGCARDLALAIGQGPEQAIAAIKELLNAATPATLEQHLATERDAMAHALGSDEAAEGIAAFLGKRKPEFR